MVSSVQSIVVRWHLVSSVLSIVVRWHLVSSVLSIVVHWHLVSSVLSIVVRWHLVSSVLSIVVRWHLVSSVLSIVRWHLVSSVLSIGAIISRRYAMMATMVVMMMEYGSALMPDVQVGCDMMVMCLDAHLCVMAGVDALRDGCPQCLVMKRYWPDVVSVTHCAISSSLSGDSCRLNS